ncbi:carbohydrate-binding module family 32 protein [Stemphylium lycopersici]|uniref:alpha,alpha-trehalase n=1 Tax=Stemphylium lycopersici TaxID=183478 RepID=A0A364NGD3_STELY|nr:carbohydrate-binding module family 32 protein [Stemphylium lycopersici]RAR16297.1 carbohydrate-binding module family 32 protein [Stemphylium lycopersici]
MLSTSFLRVTVAFLVSTHLASSSPGSEQDAFSGVTWDNDNWVISTHALDQGHYQSRLTLANGYFGINVAAAGPFFEVDKPVDGDVISGWPLFSRRQAFSTIAGFWNSQPRTNGTNYPWLYQYGWESFIAGIPHSSGLVVEANGEFLNASVNPEHISDFVSSLDVKAGIANWRYNWKPGGSGDGTIDVDYQLFVHKLHVNKAAVRLRLTSTRDMNATVYDVLDGDCAVRSTFVNKKFEQDRPTIWSAVSPGNMTNVTAYVYSTLGASSWVDLSTRSEVEEHIFGGGNGSTIAQSVAVELTAFRPTELNKFIGVASTDAFPDPQAVAQNASLSGAEEGYYKLLHSHIEEWESILAPEAVDNYVLPNGSLLNDPHVQELHILARTNPFYLLSNMVGPNAVAAADNNTKLDIYSIPVGGLGSDSYGGMIFWDSDVWMAPGIQVSHPQHAQNVIKYRVEHFEQAQKNVEMAFASSKNQTGRFTRGGAVYPWTSARFGNCTGTGACFDYEYHLNGDISLAFNNHLIITGDERYFNDTLLPISNSIAHFFGQLLDFNETSGAWELWNATDPDEYANQVNNVGFTTALMQRHFLETNEFNTWFGRSLNASWAEKASEMRLPVNDDAGIIVEYTGMNGSVAVKQADVVLVDDLLHYPNPYSLANLDYYAAKQSLDGPAMTYSSFAVVANEVSPSGCSSFTYDVYSSSPYIRAPWYQYSEQLIDNVEENGGTHPAFPFLTGMGGTNRVAIFGYLGLGLYYDRLDIDPSLPPQIQYLNYRTFYWMGHGINATSNSTHTTLVRLPREKYTLPSANATYFHEPIPVTVGTRSNRNITRHELGDEPLVVRNRPMGEILTVGGNILQCKSLLPPPQGHKPGQFPIAAIDGAASTKWQPELANTTSYLTVDLGTSAFYPVHKIVMDWANQPPAHFEVYFSNSTLPPFSSHSNGDVRHVISDEVQISAPWDPVTAYEIKTYVGNQTNVTLDESVWSGRYAHLGVKGNQFAEDATNGPTVAEWSLKTSPASELLGAHAAFSSPSTFITRQLPLSPPSSASAPAILLAYTLGSIFLVLAALNVLCTAVTRDAWDGTCSGTLGRTTRS